MSYKGTYDIYYRPWRGRLLSASPPAIDTCTGGEKPTRAVDSQARLRCGAALPSLLVGPTGVRLALLRGPLLYHAAGSSLSFPVSWRRQMRAIAGRVGCRSGGLGWRRGGLRGRSGSLGRRRGGCGGPKREPWRETGEEGASLRRGWVTASRGRHRTGRAAAPPSAAPCEEPPPPPVCRAARARERGRAPPAPGQEQSRGAAPRTRLRCSPAATARRSTPPPPAAPCRPSPAARAPPAGEGGGREGGGRLPPPQIHAVERGPTRVDPLRRSSVRRRSSAHLRRGRGTLPPSPARHAAARHAAHGRPGSPRRRGPPARVHWSR